MELVSLSKSVPPVLNHSLLSHLLVQVKKEGTSQVESYQEVDNSESILSVEWLHLPVGVPKWVLVEARDVLEGSPSLTIISWLVDIIDKLAEVALSLLGQGTANHVGTLVQVGDSIHESLNACSSLSEM